LAEVQGERIAGGFILTTGVDGVRYAFRQHAVALIQDADECHDDTSFSYIVDTSCAAHLAPPVASVAGSSGALWRVGDGFFSARD
jgi:hypothetical protein